MNENEADSLTIEELERLLDEELESLEQEENSSPDQEISYEMVHEAVSSLTVSYLPEEECYQYSFPDGNSLLISVPDGACSSQPVRVSDASGFLFLSVERDGETMLPGDSGLYAEPGDYRVILESLSVDSERGAVTDYEASLRFSVAGEYRTQKDAVTAPSGMVVKSVFREGTPVVIPKNAAQLSLSEDGGYRVEYVLLSDPEIRYTEEFILDTKMPELIFSKDISGKEIFAPVEITMSEPGLLVTVIRDGVQLPLTEHGITTGGFYTVLCEDPAGNVSEYTLRVRYGRHFPWVLWAAIAAAAVLVVLFQMIYLRRHRYIK